jgi:hypothetical protein
MTTLPNRTIGAFLVVLAGPLIWFGHFVGIYAAEALACGVLGPRFLTVVAIAITAIAGAGLLAVIIAKARESRVSALTQEPVAMFLPHVTLLLAVLSLLGLLWVAWPAAMLRPCLT